MLQGKAPRMTRAPTTSRKQAVHAIDAAATPALTSTALTSPATGTAIRPRASQILAIGGDAASPDATVQRMPKANGNLARKIAQNMKKKSHQPHGGSANTNTHAQKKGYGKSKTQRRLMNQAQNAQQKRQQG
jgi:hypothetical protein